MTAAEIASSRIVPPPAFRSTDRRREAKMIAAEGGHRPGDHEDGEADPLDVDAGAPRRLGVPADGVDVAAERRPVGDERPEDQQHHHQQPGERHPAPRIGVAACTTTKQRGRSHGDDLDDLEPGVVRRECRDGAFRSTAESDHA